MTDRPPAAAARPRLALIPAPLATLGSYTIDALFDATRWRRRFPVVFP